MKYPLNEQGMAAKTERVQKEMSCLSPSVGSIRLGLTLMMAVACGVSVANIYYNQPMIGMIGNSFPLHKILVGFIPMATQFGYAAGLLLLVPLGDRIERRLLILLQLLVLTVSLSMAALASTVWGLIAASIFVGLCASVAQQILPFAAELSRPERRGSTIGIVMSGLLCGILFGRALAGTIAIHYGWRLMFWLGLGMTMIIGAALAMVLPKSPPKSSDSYFTLLKTLKSLWQEEAALRHSTMLQACVFGSFSVLWTTLALHLHKAFHLGADIAGYFGIIGAVGILFAPVAGRLADQKGPRYVIGIACISICISWLVFGAWNQVAGLIVGVILIDLGAQGAQVSNQHVIQSLRPEARNRLNAIMMSGMFLGGAVGSALSSIAWEMFGWYGVCFCGALFSAVGLFVQLQKRPLQTVTH